MMRYVLWLCGVCGCLLVLLGCALMGGSVQQRSYVLTVPQLPSLPQPLVTRLWLQPVSMRPAFAGQLFVHRDPAGHYVRDQAHIFLTPPGQQLSHVVYQAIQHAGLATEVLQTSSVRGGGVLLTHDVTAFYVDDRQPDQSAVVITWHMVLTRLQGQAKPLPAQTWTYQQRVLVQNGDVFSAMDTAVSRTMQAMVEDLSVALRLPEESTMVAEGV